MQSWQSIDHSNAKSWFEASERRRAAVEGFTAAEAAPSLPPLPPSSSSSSNSEEGAVTRDRWPEVDAAVADAVAVAVPWPTKYSCSGKKEFV